MLSTCAAMAAPRVAQPLVGAARDHLLTLEKQWAGSVHLNMLSTPLRKCIVTSKVLPTALMLQLKAVHLPPALPDRSLSPSSCSSNADADSHSTSKPKRKSERERERGRVVILPDQILHSQFAPRKAGKGAWVTLDPRIYAHLHKRGSYKLLNPKAVLMDAMDELIWTQLGERVVQEAHLLAEQFQGRTKIDLVHSWPLAGTEQSHPNETMPISFTVDLNSSSSSGAQEAVWDPTPLFAPRFKDQAQMERFAAAIRMLGSLGDGHPSTGAQYRVKKSNVTAPLGVALYRLQLWSQSTSPTALDPDGKATQSKF